jgi:hypothetical protein
MNPTEAWERDKARRNAIAVLARIELDDHFDGLDLNAATASSHHGVQLLMDSADDAQRMAGRLGLTTYAEHRGRGASHEWSGGYRGVTVTTSGFGALTNPEPDANEEAALVALAAEVTS